MFPLRDDNPTTITPLMTWAIIAINVGVFFYQVSLGPGASQLFVYQYGAIPAAVAGNRSLPDAIESIPPVLTIFTSMFLHGGWMHLIGNMWFLWIFGNNIEEAMGRLRFFLFYLICGLLASTTHILFNTGSTLPMIGASGAVAGVLGAYLLLYPRARVLTFVFLFFFFRLIYIPAGFMLGYWFLIQILNTSAAGARAAGGVAFWAHVGGFIAGALLVGVFKKREVRFFNPPRHDAGGFYD
jgi:membrane associated rhomboid family serine protease